MRIQRLLTGIVLACGLAGTAQASSLLASGPVYGGPNQDHVACQVFNAGFTPIIFISTEIMDQQGQAIKLHFNDCGSAMGPNDTCTFQGPAGNQAYACKVRIVESKTNIRGTLAALSPSNTLLSESDLR